MSITFDFFLSEPIFFFSGLKTSFALGTQTLVPIRRNGPTARPRFQFCHKSKSVLLSLSLKKRKTKDNNELAEVVYYKAYLC